MNRRAQIDARELVRFEKLKELLEVRGMEFPADMQFSYWNDPAFKAAFGLIVELFERNGGND